MSRHVAVLKGGWSVERDVSLNSGAAVAEALRAEGFRVSEIDVERDIAARLVALKPDVVFNALHGRWGEDGCVQGILEILNIPYSHSGVRASALAMDKMRSKEIFRAAGLACAEDRLVSRDSLLDADPLPRPFVIKPVDEGSSIGVCIIRSGETVTLAENTAMLMAERYLPGRELTVTVMDGRPLTVTELKPHQNFYDYKAKYEAGKTDHIIPAALSDHILDRIMKDAASAHKALGCRGVSRVDFRLDDGPTGDHIPYILELNTQPGMTPLSLAPEQAQHCGMDFRALARWIVEDASCGR